MIRAVQPEPISPEEYESQLDQLHERRAELEELETTLTSHDHGGGLPADEQNRLARVRGRLADVLQQIGDLRDRYADAGGAPPDPEGALGE
jgi:exonuclease VII small subunit